MNIDVSGLKPLELTDADEGQTLTVIGVHEEKDRVFIFTKDGEDDYILQVYAADKAELPFGHSLSELGSFNIFFEEMGDMSRRIKRIHRICSLDAGSKLGV